MSNIKIELSELEKVNGIGKKTLQEVRKYLINKGDIEKKSIEEVGFPDKKFDVIYADPPWQYKENWGNGSNEHTYPTMGIDEIKSLPVEEISKEKSHLYLWVTNPFLGEGIELCKSWGFDYKTLLTWRKTYKDGTPEMGMGYYFRGCTEHIIFGVRGGKKCNNKTTKNHFDMVNPRWKGGLHSQKPKEFRDVIENCSSGSKIELFARERNEGWTVWGNEV